MQSNRRESQRIDARIQVQLKNGQEFITCYTQNISKGGIYLETENLPDPNATVELLFQLSPEMPSYSVSPIIPVEGRVVRLMTVSEDGRTVHKAGIQFTNIPAEIQARLNWLYDNLSKKDR